jgi:hypothetical protein
MRGEKSATAVEPTPCKKSPGKCRRPRRSIFACGSASMVVIPFGFLICFLCSIAPAAALGPGRGCGEGVGGCWDEGRGRVNGEQEAGYVFQGGGENENEGGGEGEEELQRKWGFEVSFFAFAFASPFCPFFKELSCCCLLAGGRKWIGMQVVGAGRS